MKERVVHYRSKFVKSIQFKKDFQMCLLCLFGRFLHGCSDHDIQANVLFLALQIDFLDNLKTQLAVNDWIDIIRALQIARSTFGIKLGISG